MKKILFIVGSLRKNSFNLILAKEAERILTGTAEIKYLDYEALPLMNQDMEHPEPEMVSHIRKTVMDADGIWIFTPEYNASYPGQLKNLLDWLSRPIPQSPPAPKTAIAGKKICISGVGGKGATARSREKLSELLTFIRADLMATPQLGVPLEADAFISDTFAPTDSHKKALEEQATAFLSFIS